MPKLTAIGGFNSDLLNLSLAARNRPHPQKLKTKKIGQSSSSRPAFPESSACVSGILIESP